MGLDNRQYTRYSTYMTSNTMTITVELPKANYTSRQYELFSEKGHGIAALCINRWMDSAIKARAADIAACRGDKVRIGQIGSEILSVVNKRIYAAGYETKYGATDSEPAWLIGKHIAKVCCQIGGLDRDELKAW